MKLIDLYKSWTAEQKKQALSAMPVFRRSELASELRAAGWTHSELSAAGWTHSELSAAGCAFRELDENIYAEDIKGKSAKMGRVEAEYVRDTLIAGLMNGSNYGNIYTCGCFLGSAAKKSGLSIEDFCKKFKIEKDPSSPSERWFLFVRVGNTPDNCYAAKKGVEWINEALAEMK